MSMQIIIARYSCMRLGDRKRTPIRLVAIPVIRYTNQIFFSTIYILHGIFLFPGSYFLGIVHSRTLYDSHNSSVDYAAELTYIYMFCFYNPYFPLYLLVVYPNLFY